MFSGKCTAALQTGSPRSPRCILVEDVLEHLSCGLCRGPVASSLILSCSHLFCGDCLWQHLQKRQSCPTCSMALRAVPVRCLAMDKVAASIVPSLPQQQQQQYAKRYKDGQCTADKVSLQLACQHTSGSSHVVQRQADHTENRSTFPITCPCHAAVLCYSPTCVYVGA